MYTKYNILLLCTVRSVCHKHKYTSFVRETRENCEKQPAVFVHTPRTISTRARMERFVDPITLSVLFIIESSMNSFRKQDVFFHSALCRTLNCVVNRTLLQSYINFCVSSRKMVLLRNSVNFLFWSTYFDANSDVCILLKFDARLFWVFNQFVTFPLPKDSFCVLFIKHFTVYFVFIQIFRAASFFPDWNWVQSDFRCHCKNFPRFQLIFVFEKCESLYH